MFSKNSKLSVKVTYFVGAFGTRFFCCAGGTDFGTGFDSTMVGLVSDGSSTNNRIFGGSGFCIVGSGDFASFGDGQVLPAEFKKK